MASFIQFENVEKCYGTGAASVRALHDATFTVERGEICVIVGPSGAGKTTLLNILGGMDTLTSGRVFLDGREVSAFNRRQLAQIILPPRAHYHSISSMGTGFSLTAMDWTVPFLIWMTRSAMAVSAELCVMMMTVIPFSRLCFCNSARICLPVL